MSDYQSALAALREHLIRAAGDPSLILDPATARAAGTVQAADIDPGTELDAAHALGWYHWLRYLALPEGLRGSRTRPLVLTWASRRRACIL